MTDELWASIEDAVPAHRLTHESVARWTKALISRAPEMGRAGAAQACVVGFVGRSGGDSRLALAWRPLMASKVNDNRTEETDE
jgi:hypothetical protein